MVTETPILTKRGYNSSQWLSIPPGILGKPRVPVTRISMMYGFGLLNKDTISLQLAVYQAQSYTLIHH